MGTSAIGFGIIGAKLLMYPRLAERGAATTVLPCLRQACDRFKALTKGPNALALVWPLSLSYQVMYFARARVVLGSGGTGSGLVYNVGLRQRIQVHGLDALQGDEFPDFLFLFDGCPFQVDDSIWMRALRSGCISVYARRSVIGSQ